MKQKTANNVHDVTFFDRVLRHFVDPPSSNAAVASVSEKPHVQPLRVGVLVEDTGRGVFVRDANLTMEHCSNNLCLMFEKQSSYHNALRSPLQLLVVVDDEGG